jgi:hypothetical protein
MKHITIFTPPGRPGTVADIAERLGARGVNIEHINAGDYNARGVIIIDAEPYDVALHVLGEAGYDAISEDLIAIRIKDEPGALAKVSARFREPQINIQSMRFMQRDAGWATVILCTSDNDRARSLLADCLI